MKVDYFCLQYILYDAVMSADEKPSVILKSLEEGVAFYMVKPISLDDVKHVWQYAISPKNVIPNQTITITQRQLSIENSSSSSALCLKKEIIKSKSTKFKNKKAKQKSIPLRKPKVIWTNSLHNRFLQAIRLIGLHSKSLSLLQFQIIFSSNSLVFLII